MSGINDFMDGAEIGLPCPSCDHETPKSIGWIKSNDEFVCAGCGGTVDMKAPDFRQTLADVYREIGNFAKQLKKL